MPSSSPLEAPAEWPVENNRGRFVLAFAVLIVLGVLSVGVGVMAVGAGFAGALKYAAHFAALCWLATGFGYLTRLRPQHRVADIGVTTIEGRPATEIRYSGAQFMLINLVMLCLLLFGGFAAWAYRSPGGEAFAPDIPMFAAAVVALLFLSYFVLVVLGRVRRGRIVLAADGIHQEGRAFESFLPWESFAGVKASYNRTCEVLVIACSNAPWQKRQLSALWKLDKLPPVPMIEIDTIHLAVDPKLVYHLVRFYVENPDARVEFGTEAVLRRVREQAF